MKMKKISDVKSLTDQEMMALEELVFKVKHVFRVKNIFLFGSKARGDSNENSDVDIMIIIEEDEAKENRNKLSEISFEVNYEYDTNIYAGLDYGSKWEDKDYLLLPLPSNITEEGVELSV
ncbi:nucleotidyltransferase family protein [Paenibacillus yanchengensis]|uniref:Nucleotidyltransferase family protein n=1 Tax=Paenibacillus yanchengensis TaxID=2035833 RepID=A0ABW4YNL1_9BACL